MQKHKNILLTGGHAAATAYALISFMKPREKDWKFYWVGPKSYIEGKSVESLENNEFRRLGVRVFSLDAGRVQRKFTVWTIPSLLKIPSGLIKAFFLLNKIKPDVVLTFGGFVGLPMAFAAKIRRIPVVVHEQTAAAGRGNLVASKFADKIAISRSTSCQYFNKKKTVLTGNPIDPNIMKVPVKNKISDPPVLFITGGHTGSLTINDNISRILKNLLIEFKVIHQTGKLDYDRFWSMRETLPKDLRARYIIHRTISPKDWPGTLTGADMVISRAGANTVSQLMVVKRPAILIPIPFSYLNEQYENAKYASEFGIAKVIEDKDLNATNLLQCIREVKENWSAILKRTSGKRSPDENAAEKIYEIIKSLI